MNKPEALELADLFDRGGTTNALHRAAATELRRLHQSEQEGWRWAAECEAEVKRVKRVNQELVEALEYHQEQTRPIQRTIDVLAKHKEQA